MKEKTLVQHIYTSFEEVTEFNNQVRDDLIAMGVLWKGSKLDKVQCFYERVAPVSAVTGRLAYSNEDKGDRQNLPGHSRLKRNGPPWRRS